MHRTTLAALLFVAASMLGSSVAHARLGDCSQPRSDGSLPTVTDCLAILKAAVGLEPCFRGCVCAVRGLDRTTVVDAQACLRASSGNTDALACSCGPKEPIARLRLSVDATYYWPGDTPQTLHFFLALSADGTGQLGLVESEGVPAASIWPTQWTRDGEDIRIEGGDVKVWSDAWLYWSPFTIRLDPAPQGRDVSVSAVGTMPSASVEVLYGDVVFTSEIRDGTLVAETDAEAPVLRLETSVRHDATFVGDTFTVLASEPVARDEMASRVRLLADGEPVAAAVSVRRAAGIFTTAIKVAPLDYVPFASVLAVDPGGLVDPVGHEASWDGDSKTTMADPGPASANPDFELEEPHPGYGWSGAPIRPRFDPSRAPGVDHDAYLDTYAGDSMLGYFDLPVDALALQFSAQIDGGCLDQYCLQGVGVELLTPGRRRPAYRPVFEPLPDSSSDWCYSGVFAIPERSVSVDVSDLAGQRVFVYAHAFSGILCDDYALALDDFRVSTTTAASSTTTTTVSTTTTTLAGSHAHRTGSG